VDVCVKIDYTAGENVINSSTNKGLRRLYNANSKNRVGLRGCKGKRTCGIVERGMGDAIGWRDGQETIQTRAATSSLLDTTAWHRQPLRIPSVYPSTSHPPVLLYEPARNPPSSL